MYLKVSHGRLIGARAVGEEVRTGHKGRREFLGRIAQQLWTKCGRVGNGRGYPRGIPPRPPGPLDTASNGIANTEGGVSAVRDSPRPLCPKSSLYNRCCPGESHPGPLVVASMVVES